MYLADLIRIFITIGYILLALIFIGGLVFLITGIASKKKPKNTGKIFPTVFTVVGSFMVFIPVVTVIFLAVGKLATENIPSIESLKVEEKSYDNLRDKWKNTWTTDKSAANDAMEELFAAAEAGDREKLADLFAPTLRQQEQGFDDALDEFLQMYPKGLEIDKLDFEGGSMHSSARYGHNIKSTSKMYTCVNDGEWYFIRLELCYQATDYPDDVGIMLFSIENLESCALDDLDYDEIYLKCRIIDESEVTARLINGSACLFEPYPDRKLTEEQMIEYLETCENLRELYEKIGEPNAVKEFESTEHVTFTSNDYYYELVPENGEPRYARISAGHRDYRFYDGYICSDTKCFYDRPLITREDKTDKTEKTEE